MRADGSSNELRFVGGRASESSFRSHDTPFAHSLPVPLKLKRSLENLKSSWASARSLETFFNVFVDRLYVLSVSVPTDRVSPLGIAPICRRTVSVTFVVGVWDSFGGSVEIIFRPSRVCFNSVAGPLTTVGAIPFASPLDVATRRVGSNIFVRPPHALPRGD